jgi:hydrogenase maturation protein HypF
LGIAWDGTGFGLDGTIWGGEFLWLPLEPLPDLGFVRVAHLRSFLLPGGERAVREPRRAALGLLYECLGEAAFDRLDLLPLKSFEAKELAILKKALQKKINSPRTSSMGRLFDAIASLLGLCQTASFEGQAAMQLEYAIGNSITDATYPYGVQKDGDRPLQLDFAPAIAALLQELKDRTPSNLIAATFHNTMVAGLIEIACQLRNQYPAMERAVLSGGCFQNRYLSERSLRLLEREGFVVGCHRQLPCNDGGLSAGQIVAALRHLASISHRSIAGVH